MVKFLQYYSLRLVFTLASPTTLGSKIVDVSVIDWAIQCRMQSGVAGRRARASARYSIQYQT